MNRFSVRRCLASAALVLIVGSPHGVGQSEPSAPKPAKDTLRASNIVRRHGTDSDSSIEWMRLILNGTVATGAAGESGPPLLIAQCTKRPNGQFRFEMFASFGDATDLAFYPPWKPKSPQDLFPPATQKVTLTMDFLGYTHVKPLRRQWEVPVETPGLYRFNSPGRTSSNLEDIGYDLRYMLALPTLRLSGIAGRTAEFMTTPLLAEIRNEPLCRAAGL